jgi:hypothetical protein
MYDFKLTDEVISTIYHTKQLSKLLNDKSGGIKEIIVTPNSFKLNWGEKRGIQEIKFDKFSVNA